MYKYINLDFQPLVDPNKAYEENVCDTMETTLQFGRFKGKTLHEMVLNSSGRSYLEWMASDESTFKDNLKEKVNLVLEFAHKQLEDLQLAQKQLGETGIDIRGFFGGGKPKKLTEL